MAPLATPTSSCDGPPFANKKIWGDIFFIASFLVSSSHETFVVMEIVGFFFRGGVSIVEVVCRCSFMRRAVSCDVLSLESRRASTVRRY